MGEADVLMPEKVVESLLGENGDLIQVEQMMWRGGGDVDIECWLREKASFKQAVLMLMPEKVASICGKWCCSRYW